MMKEVIISKVAAVSNNNDKMQYLREQLQLLILKIMDEKGFFRSLAFVGGAALRILYDLNRFSEDLDFSLTEASYFDFANFVTVLQRELQLRNLSVNFSPSKDKTVFSVFLRFNDLMQEAKLSPHKDQKISIKIEIDQNPPAGFNLVHSMTNKGFLFEVQHYDLPSLYAGKLHAILFRKYSKGRDFYDFMWYQARGTKPNYCLLSNAIFQTTNERIELDAEKLRSLLVEKFTSLDFAKIAKDVEPFLQIPSEIRFFKQAYFIQMAQAILV